MDVIDEGKSNRHVAVTSESLSHSLINQAHDVRSTVNTWIFHHKMETKLKKKKSLTVGSFWASILRSLALLFLFVHVRADDPVDV